MRSLSLNMAMTVCASIVLGTLLSGIPAPAIAQQQVADGQIPFLTLRNRTNTQDPGQYFGDARSDLKAGWCRVRRLDLSALGNLADSAPGFIKEEFLSVDQVSETRADVVLDALEKTVGDQNPVLYVHGFNIGFDKGCRRAHLLRQNAELDGRFLWFSWPSDGALTNYTRDEADLYWSVPDIAEAIFEMENRFGADNVNIVGHSLGARGIVLALNEVANRRPEIQLGDVVLLAADMDFQIFERILPRIRPIAKSVTLYVNASDRPLALSEQLHGYPRLGQAGNDVSRLDGVDVIDLSNLPDHDPTGHLYHIYNEGLGDDLAHLLKDGTRAAGRASLTRAGQNLWRLGR